MCVSIVGKVDFFHKCWICEEIRTFWNLIYNKISIITGFYIPFKPRFYLLNVLETMGLGKMDVSVEKLNSYLLIAALILLVKCWKSSDLPTKGEWV